MDALQQRLREHFAAYDAYVATLTTQQLEQRLPLAKHKSVGEHLWCVLGARESYAKALVAGSWQGFSCSTGTSDLDAFEEGFKASALAIESAWSQLTWTPKRVQLVLDLLEHEVMHQGQLIRHEYALGHARPTSWKWA